MREGHNYIMNSLSKEVVFELGPDYLKKKKSTMEKYWDRKSESWNSKSKPLRKENKPVIYKRYK